jgi:hypothetical protein
MGVQLLLWLGLGRHSKQAGNEGDQPADVSFAHPSDLPLAYRVQDLVSLQCSLCCLEGKEAHPWLDQPLDEAMVLFDDVVEILDLPQFHAFRQDPTRFEVGHRFGRGCMLIHVDDTGADVVVGSAGPVGGTTCSSTGRA